MGNYDDFGYDDDENDCDDIADDDNTYGDDDYDDDDDNDAVSHLQPERTFVLLHLRPKNWVTTLHYAFLHVVRSFTR